MTHVLLGALVVLVAGHLAVWWSVTRILRVLARNTDGLKDVSGVSRDEFEELANLIDRLPARWEQIHAEADRIFKRARSAEERARASVARTQAQLDDLGLREDPLEELAGELGLQHGERGDGQGVPSVSQDMEGTPPSDDREAWFEFARQRLRGQA